MSKESTSGNWCSCATSHLDECVSEYMDVGGRCLHVTSYFLVVLHMKPILWSWCHVCFVGREHLICLDVAHQVVWLEFLDIGLHAVGVMVDMDWK
jgi:hypothetical protein